MHRDTLLNLWHKTALNGLPTAALAAFALTRFPWVGYALALATLVYGWSRYGLDGLGKHRMGRVLAVAAVLVEVARPGDTGLGLPLAITGVLLVGLIGHEQLLAKALMTGKMRTVNLGVRRTGADRLLDARWAYLLVSALTAAFLACAAFSWMVWPLAVAAVAVGALFFVAVVAAWWERRSAAHQMDAEVHAALVRVAPRFIVHFSAPAGSEYQLLMWLPYLDMLGMPYVIALREPHALPVVSAATKRPIVVATTIGNLEHIIVDSMSAVFYVNNGMKNTHCVRFSELTHVQLLHGDSDKPSSYNPITAMFDRIYVAGQAGIDRYHKHGVHIPAEQFRIVGRPQVAEVAVTDRDIAEIESPVVLYAPTWTGMSSDVNYSSLGVGQRILRALIARGATVILREHPYTTRNPASAQQLQQLQHMLHEDRARSGRKHRFGKAATTELSLFECINAADAMISDVSAVASDWLYSEKPFATTDMAGEGANFAETFPLSRAAYIIDHEAADVDRVLQELLRDDPLAATRREMKTYYLGDFSDVDYVRGFLDEATRCIERADETDRPDEVDALVQSADPATG